MRKMAPSVSYLEVITITITITIAIRPEKMITHFWDKITKIIIFLTIFAD